MTHPPSIKSANSELPQLSQLPPPTMAIPDPVKNLAKKVVAYPETSVPYISVKDYLIEHQRNPITPRAYHNFNVIKF
jgi:hypothetical protein